MKKSKKEVKYIVRIKPYDSALWQIRRRFEGHEWELTGKEAQKGEFYFETYTIDIRKHCEWISGDPLVDVIKSGSLGCVRELKVYIDGVITAGSYTLSSEEAEKLRLALNKAAVL